MVRLIPVEIRGRVVWMEDAPAACGAGHRTLRPGTGGCPQCGEPVRTWTCGETGCAAPVLYDDEHEHDSRKR